MPTLALAKIAAVIAFCSILLGIGFYSGKTYQKGVVAEERLEETKTLMKVTEERNTYKRDLEALTAQLDKASKEAKVKVEQATADVVKVQTELKTTRTALSAKLAEINRLAATRDAALDATPAKSGTPRCRGPILSPGLLHDINSAIEVTQ